MSLSAASDPARHLALRALGRRHAAVSRWARAALCALAAALALPGAAAYAQSANANGQIYIPGPGEAHSAQPSAMISIPGPGETRGATSSGMISIPGPGETHAATAHANGAETNAMIVIPGPGEARPGAQATAPQRIGALPHPAPRTTNAAVAAAPASGRTIPVVVTAPQRAVRAVQPIAVEPAAHAGLAAPVAASSGTPRMQAVAVAAPAPAPAPAATPAAVAATAAAPAATAPAGQEDGETIRRAALAYLEQQTVGLPGKIAVNVKPVFPRGLAACTTLEPFMPTGARLWGRTTVGVRCAGAKPWTLYLQAQVSIEATYYLAARQIEPGSVVTTEDLLARNGDLSNLPRAIITDPSQAVGAVALARISAGMPLRQDLLKSASAVTIGQMVRVVAQGQDFTISSEGSVMNNASPGQQVRVKMAGGQVISGIVKDGATVQVQM